MLFNNIHYTLNLQVMCKWIGIEIKQKYDFSVFNLACWNSLIYSTGARTLNELTYLYIDAWHWWRMYCISCVMGGCLE